MLRFVLSLYKIEIKIENFFIDKFVLLLFFVNMSDSIRLLNVSFQYTGGSGCVETDPERLKGANPSELAADLNSFLDNVDLSSAKAKSDTNNVVSAVMTNSPDGPKR